MAAEKKATIPSDPAAVDDLRYKYQLAPATKEGMEKLMLWVNAYAASHRLVSLVRLETAICAVIESQKWKPSTINGSFFDEDDV